MKNVRKSFEITHREHGDTYTVKCIICEKSSKAWDYRHNALLVGWYHVLHEHAPEMVRKAGWH